MGVDKIIKGSRHSTQEERAEDWPLENTHSWVDKGVSLAQEAEEEWEERKEHEQEVTLS